ncbi:hypothetical protein VNO77_27566 [Canavalia gladiata]|uniref:Single CXXC unit domain-containing protein n=1 Tax=Canavalia gladiata TaxID=3824 RepID=A0AAN9KX62_CANGL
MVEMVNLLGDVLEITMGSIPVSMGTCATWEESQLVSMLEITMGSIPVSIGTCATWEESQRARTPVSDRTYRAHDPVTPSVPNSARVIVASG